MDRRTFLKSLLGSAAVAAAPKLIFDMGANLWKPQYNLSYDFAHYEEVIIGGKYPFVILNTDAIGEVETTPWIWKAREPYPRRFCLNENGIMVEVFKS